MGFGRVELRVEQVGSELAQRVMDRLGPCLEQLDDRGIDWSPYQGAPDVAGSRFAPFL